VYPIVFWQKSGSMFARIKTISISKVPSFQLSVLIPVHSFRDAPVWQYQTTVKISTFYPKFQHLLIADLDNIAVLQNDRDTGLDRLPVQLGAK